MSTGTIKTSSGHGRLPWGPVTLRPGKFHRLTECRPLQGAAPLATVLHLFKKSSGSCSQLRAQRSMMPFGGQGCLSGFTFLHFVIFFFPFKTTLGISASDLGTVRKGNLVHSVHTYSLNMHHSLAPWGVGSQGRQRQGHGVEEHTVRGGDRCVNNEAGSQVTASIKEGQTVNSARSGDQGRIPRGADAAS